MDLLERTIRELKDESAFVVKHLQNWWNTMPMAEQAFTLGTICAAFLLIAVLPPVQKKVSTVGPDNQTDMGTAKVFILAAVILIIMTFGLDIAIDGVS
ncbi:MAG: hypothetical protein ABJG15_02930 [Hyphomonadaceae bacterium]